MWAQAGSEDAASLRAREGSSRQCPPARCPRFPRHQCEEETQAVASSDSRQGRAASQLPLCPRPPAAPPPLGAPEASHLCNGERECFTPTV